MLLTQLSALAPLLLLFIEEAGIPIFVPGDAFIAYTGYTIQISHHSSLILAFFVAVAAILCGSTTLFFVSRKYGEAVVERVGKFVFLKPRHLKRAERLFNRYGMWAIIIGRHIPGMRIPITIFAAISGVRYVTFIFSTFVSTFLYVWFYLYIGGRYGEDIKHIVLHSITITAIVVAVIIVAVIGLHLHGRQRRRSRSEGSS